MHVRDARRPISVTTGSQFLFVLAVAAALLLTAAATAQAETPSIRWLSVGERQMPLQRAEAASAAIERIASDGSSRHIVVQFDRPLSTDERDRLADSGVVLQSYLGGNAFFAAVTPDALDAGALGRFAPLRSATAIETTLKLHPAFISGELPSHAVVEEAEGDGDETIVAAYVVFHEDINLDIDAYALCAAHNAAVRSALRSINGLVIELPKSQITQLAANDAVKWIEPPLPRMGRCNDSNRAITQADDAQAAPYNLDGSGVKVMVYDAGTARSTHVDFQGRLTVRDSSGMNDHPTHVSGTIGGAGVANAAYKGMAPGVTIEAYGFEGDLVAGFLYTDPGDLEADYNQAINTYGCDIANNSIGSNVESNGFDCSWQGNYGATSALIDEIVRGSLGAPFRIIWANGNERQGSRCDVEGFGDYYSMPPPAGAKNSISVGALNSNDDSMTSFSSWGPMDDGRLKPDICGPGCQSGGDGGVTSTFDTSDTAYGTFCGTSMACPTVTGLCALLLEDYRVQFAGQPDPRNSTLKILLAHNAVDLGNAGPDYVYGYGSVRIRDTIDFMRLGHFLEQEVSQGDTFTVLIPVGAGDPALKVTLAWDDFPGTPNVNPTLVNDLDLRVFNPSNVRYYPWTLNPANPSAAAVQTQEDHTNNIEQVYVASPAAGTWRIEIHGFNVPQGPQPFSVCASPGLIKCSSAGTITLDKTKYGCEDTAEIKVIDCDLNTDDGVIETVNVTIVSTSEPGGEIVQLTETAAESADFRGTISLSETNAPGVLLVANGDTITATYIDADDGEGGINVVVTADAPIDCQGPIISAVQVASLDSGSATITFTTDEAANGTIRYGLSCGSLGDSQAEVGYKTAHTIVLTGLSNNTTYYFAVDAEDVGGNESTDDNGGACYTFTTPNIPDDCIDAIEACPGSVYSGTTVGMNNDGSASCGDSATSPDVWYVYTPGENGTATFSLCSGTTYDSVLSIHTGCPGTTANEVGCDDDFCSGGGPSQVTIGVTEGVTYYIRVTGWNGSAGNYSLEISGPECGGDALAISFPNGLPEAIEPDVATTFDVTIQDDQETYVPGSGTLYYRYDGGSFQTAPLTELGGEMFEATLPAPACGDFAEYYISAEGNLGSIVLRPPSAPASLYESLVGTLTTVIDDNFESDLGWTTGVVGSPSSGFWQRGTPVNDPGWEYDPITDADGSGQCYLTQNETGNTDIDGGGVVLISPTLDMSAGNMTISYFYFLRLTNDDGTDKILVEISSNGDAGPWTEIARHDDDAGLVWMSHTITQNDLDVAGVTLTANMKMRFTANDDDPASINESAIDGFKVVGFTCVDPILTGACCFNDESCSDDVTEAACIAGLGAYQGDGTSCGDGVCPCVGVMGDMNEDAIVNGSDIQLFVYALLEEYHPCADFDDDDAMTSADIDGMLQALGL